MDLLHLAAVFLISAAIVAILLVREERKARRRLSRIDRPADDWHNWQWRARR